MTPAILTPAIAPALTIARGGDRGALAERVRALPAGLALIVFEGGAAHPFGPQDAALAVALANAPDAGTFPLAFVDAPIAGRDLALCLRCAMIVVAPGARVDTSFGTPAAAAVYAGAAARIGTTAAERLLFRGVPASAEEAVEAGLALAADDLAQATALGTARLSTMLCVAKAFLVTWPFTPAMAEALIDALPSRA